MKEQVPDKITGALRIWDKLAKNLRRLFIFLGVVSIVCSLVVATFNNELGPLWTKVFAFSSALSLGVLTGFDVGGKSNDVRNAFRHLTAAILKYEKVASYTIEDLVDAYEEAEKMVGHPVFSHKKSS